MTFKPDPRDPTSPINRVRAIARQWRRKNALPALARSAWAAAVALEAGPCTPNALGNPLGITNPAPDALRVALAYGRSARTFHWDGLALELPWMNSAGRAWAEQITGLDNGTSGWDLHCAVGAVPGALAGLEGAAAGLIRDAFDGEPAEGLVEAIAAIAFMRRQTPELTALRKAGLTPGLIAASDGERIFTLPVALRPARKRGNR